MAQGRRVGVVGAGVIGLTTALLAQADGSQVTIYSDRGPYLTTSTKAAASFKPVDVAYTDETHRMLEIAWDAFAGLERDFPVACGVRSHVHWDAGSLAFDPPRYLDLFEHVDVLERPHVPGGYAFAYRYVTFFIDTTVFLPWLVGRFTANGGTFVQRSFATLDEIATLPCEIVVNCTGLGARMLCGDDLLIPVKGQIVVIDAQPAMDWSIKADGFYVYPRESDTVLGGTAEWNVSDETPDAGAVDAILRANKRILPQLKPEDIRRTYAGLRPYRQDRIRVERDDTRAIPIVHNYGHGGAGFTLCWGSARLALDLVR